jgi:hypothetical protein
MVTYMPMPQFKLTLGTTPFENDIMLSAKVTRNENNFDLATIVLSDTSLYDGTVTAGTAVQLDVKDASESYPALPMFKGEVRFLVPDITKDGRTLTLSCFGSGFGLGEMLVGAEYGSTSIHPSIDTPTEIVTDIINNYVKKILAVATSGFDYTVLTTVANSIPYINFPYKTANASLNDLVDLVTAQEAGDPGIHWIVTTDNVLHMKFISATQTGWTKWYGGDDNDDDQATLTYGEDYTSINLEKMGSECNYLMYYGKWRRPSNGDYWTEGTASLWDSETEGEPTDDNTTGQYRVNNYSIKLGPTGNVAWYPAAQNAAWNFTGFSDFNVPTLNFYILKHGSPDNVSVRLYTSNADLMLNYYAKTLQAGMANNDVFYHFSLPVGPYYRTADSTFEWTTVGTAPNWSQINFIYFGWAGDAGDYICIDGLYFGDADICRVAWNSSLPGGVARMKLITDNVGKDDSLKSGTPGTTDQGLMALLAYSELSRLQKEALVGTVLTPMIKDALPGQLFRIQETPFRVTKIVHNIDATKGYTSTFSITDDVINGRARLRYEDINKIYAAIRPEFQDRASSSLKLGTCDWRITPLIEDYA